MFTLVPYHSCGSNSNWYGFQIWHRRSQVQMKYNSAGDTFEALGSSHPEPFLAAGSYLRACFLGPALTFRTSSSFSSCSSPFFVTMREQAVTSPPASWGGGGGGGVSPTTPLFFYHVTWSKGTDWLVGNFEGPDSAGECDKKSMGVWQDRDRLE